VPQARLAESGAPPCEGDRSDRQCRCAEAVQRGALLILIGIPVYVRRLMAGRREARTGGTMSIERKQDG
jgi:hypothetical protein